MMAEYVALQHTWDSITPDAKVDAVWKRMIKLEEMLPKDLNVRLQQLEAQDRIGALSRSDMDTQQLFALVEGANQRIEDEKLVRRTDVSSLKTMFESLRHDLKIEEARRQQDSEKLQQQAEMTAVAIARTEASITEGNASIHPSTSIGSTRREGQPGSSNASECGTSFDLPELLTPEIQSAVSSAEARLKQVTEERCARIEHSIQAHLATVQSNLESITGQLDSAKSSTELIEQRLLDRESSVEDRLRQAAEMRIASIEEFLKDGELNLQDMQDQVNLNKLNTESLEARLQRVVDREKDREYSTEVRLRQATEERCAKTEQSIREDLASMQLHVQAIKNQLYSNAGNESVEADLVERAKKMRTEEAQLQATAAELLVGSECVEERLLERERKVRAEEAQLRNAAAELHSGTQMQRLVLDAARLRKMAAQETDDTGRGHDELEQRLEAVEGVAEKWLKRIGGTVESAAQQLSKIESQLIVALSAGGKDSESASCLISLFQYLISLFQCLETERINCQAQLETTRSKITDAPPLPHTLLQPLSSLVPPSSLLPGSAAGSESAIDSGITEIQVLEATESARREALMRPTELQPAQPPSGGGSLELRSAGGPNSGEQALWNTRMQSLVQKLDALQAENENLYVANCQMADQVAALGGKPILTKDKVAMPKVVGGREPSPRRLVTVPVTGYVPNSSAGMGMEPLPRLNSVTLETNRAAATIATRNFSPPRNMGLDSSRREGDASRVRSVSPSQLQPGPAQPLQQQQQPQRPNPATMQWPIQLSSPTQSGRCISPPRSLAQPAPHTVRAPIGIQPRRSVGTGPASMGVMVLGQPLGQRSPISSMRECR